MELKKFIQDFKNKKIIADPTLPKYQDLIKKKVKETGEKVGGEKNIEKASLSAPGTMTSAEWHDFSDRNERVATEVSPHVKELIDKEYTEYEKLLKEHGGVILFNAAISHYLKVESGWGVDLKVKGDRPGITNKFDLGNSLSSGLNFEDQIAFRTISQSRLDKARPGWIDRVLGVFSKKYYDKVMLEANHQLIGEGWEEARRKAETITATLSVEDFFSQVKVKINEEKEFINHLKIIYSQISQAKIMGQNALLEELAEKVVINVYEGALHANGLRRYITLDNLKELAEKSPRGLCIDLVGNFTRIIPADVVEKKEVADQMRIFDQYVILHFDPENKNTKDTKQEATAKEEARKKDPILFGLILDSDKLYYIADWEDEYCDLTWEKMMEILGREQDGEKNTLQTMR